MNGLERHRMNVGAALRRANAHGARGEVIMGCWRALEVARHYVYSSVPSYTLAPDVTDKLVDFARAVLEILDAEDDWSADELDFIAAAAYDRGLAGRDDDDNIRYREPPK